MPFFERVQSGLVSVAAWVQNSFFEPEKCVGTYVQYSRTGRITKTDHQPDIVPGTAVWQLLPGDCGSYTRLPGSRADYGAKQLELPLIQVVVQVPKFRKRRGRTVNDGSNRANYDITSEMGIFGGDPMLDWLHVGLCVAHRYGVHAVPGEYSLSIIDGLCGLHTVAPAEAAVFSVRGERQTGGQPEQSNPAPVSLLSVAPKASAEAEETNEWSEPEPEVGDTDSLTGLDSDDAPGEDESDPEPDFDD